jgi:hypothetical protein
MSLNRSFRSLVPKVFAATILAAGSPALVADNPSSPAPVAAARITALSGTLLDGQGKPLNVGSEVKSGDVVKTLRGESARLVLGKGGTSSSIICIQPGSEVAFVKLSPSKDSDYPVLDTEISLRNARVRTDSKRVF